MTRDRDARLFDLFDRALRLRGAERSEFLDVECAEDADLRADVESLLENDDDGFLRESNSGPWPFVGRPRALPTDIGPYRIVSELGGGGMGVVYLAQQQSPVKRKVALKLIKQGMDTEQVVVRFDAERQALALMNHLNIARVFDGGATDEGRPYFVMEYVPGIPITDHCDRHRVPIPKRLELFIQVCEGIHHAHQKGVIHRDVKASNVLVTIQDDVAIPKIIDFGIAKATDHRLTAATLCTVSGDLVGTPEYMSPEQADLTEQDIDIRTDVYSLGVLLYVLLTGRLPLERDGSGQNSLERFRLRVLEEDPLAPSTRFTKLGKEIDEVSRRRGEDVASILRELRGDLDWIALQAMAKDRMRRYPSASELAADVRRYLKHEPVVARAPSTVYRLRKFVRRHRGGVAAASVAVVALLLGAAGATAGMMRAKRAEQAAVAAQERATLEAEAAGKMSDFLGGVFDLSNPEKKRKGGEVTAREILDEQAEKIKLESDPQLRARFSFKIAEAYLGLGLDEKALELFRSCLVDRQRLYGDGHEKVFATKNEIGRALGDLGRYEDALRYYREALTDAEALRGPDHPDVAGAAKNIADIYVITGRLEEARQLLNRALTIRVASFGGDSPVVARTQSSLATVLSKSGDHEGAAELHRRSLEIRQEIRGALDYQTGYGHYFLAASLRDAERFDPSRVHFTSALKILEDQLGPTHPDTRDCRFCLAEVMLLGGDWAAGEALYREALALEEGLESTSPDVARSIEVYGESLRDRGRARESEGVLAIASTIRERISQ